MNHRGERPFSCVECGHGFTEIAKLRRHMLTHNGEKSHKCDLCGKTFALKYNLKKHQLIHTDIRPHECVTCGKRFTQKSNLNTHLKIHIKNRVEQTLVCAQCGKIFKNAWRLQNHITNICHKKEKRSDAGKKESKDGPKKEGIECENKCTVCGTTFTVQKSLKRHMTKHGKASDGNSLMDATCFERCCTLKIIKGSFADTFFKARKKRRKFTICCFICNRSLNTPVAFLHHVKTIHVFEDPGVNMVACSECSNVFYLADMIDTAQSWLDHKCVSNKYLKGITKGTVTLQKVIIEGPSSAENSLETNLDKIM